MRRCSLPDGKQCLQDDIKQRSIRTDGKSEQATVLALKNCLREEQLMPLWSTFILLNQMPQSLFYQLDLLLFVSLCWDEPKTWLVFIAVQGVNNMLSKQKNEEEVLVSLLCCISFRDVSEPINFYWNLHVWNELKCILMDYSSWKFTLRKKIAHYKHCFIS